MNLHSLASKLNRIEEKLGERGGTHLRVHTLNLPVDAPESVCKRMIKEAKAAIAPMDDLRFDSLIVVGWTGDGSKFNPDEKWELTGGDLQECVR